MTTDHTPPEDAFDQWLDALADGDHRPIDDERAGTAASLHRHLGLPAHANTRLPSATRAAIRERVFADRTGAEAPATHKPSTGIGIIPVERARPAWRVVSLAAAAVLALLAVATIAAFLRLDDGDHSGGIGATASILPFAPSSALASPTPATSCATDDTLLLTPEEPVAPGTFAHLPFPVAWYDDGTLTVEQSGEVLREIEIGEVDYLSPTGWPGVVMIGTTAMPSDRSFVNIRTGEAVDVGPSVRDVWTPGPFHFWTPDAALHDWHVIDLRTFEHVALNDRFAFVPERPWSPSIFSGQQVGPDGTVLLVEAYLASSMTIPDPDATPEPVNPDLPEFDIGNNALLIGGSLDAISAVGPIATANGDMALSPDGETVAWLAPSETAGTRVLTIADVATGDVVHTQRLRTEHPASIRFDGNGENLLVVSDASLDTLALEPDAATPIAQSGSVPLPDEGYRIVAMTANGQQVLLAEAGTADVDGRLLWIDLDTGATQEFTGQVQPGQILAPGTVRTAGSIGTHVVLDDLERELSVLDLETGEVIATLDRMAGRGALTILRDTSWLLIPGEGQVDALDLNDGTRETIDLPEGYDGVPWVAPSSDGGCATTTHFEQDVVTGVALIDPTSRTVVDLPDVSSAWWLPGEP